MCSAYDTSSSRQLAAAPSSASTINRATAASVSSEPPGGRACTGSAAAEAEPGACAAAATSRPRSCRATSSGSSVSSMCLRKIRRRNTAPHACCISVSVAADLVARPSRSAIAAASAPKLPLRGLFRTSSAQYALDMAVTSSTELPAGKETADASSSCQKRSSDGMGSRPVSRSSRGAVGCLAAPAPMLRFAFLGVGKVTVGLGAYEVGGWPPTGDVRYTPKWSGRGVGGDHPSPNRNHQPPLPPMIPS